MNWLMLWPLGIVIIGFILFGMLWLASHWKWRDGGYTMQHARFMDEAMAQGKSYQEIMDEQEVRSIFARIRRKASDAVIAAPVHWQSIIKSEIDGEIEKLARLEPRLVPMLSGMFGGLSYGQILYPDAAAIVDRLTEQKHDVMPTVDRWAATRRVTPG